MAENRSVTIEIPLGAASEAFDLERAVCSHGLFMMSPNHWDPLTRTFSRPLLLNHHPSSPSHSVLVSISHQLPNSLFLLLRVHGTRSLSPEHRDSLSRQVVRMLRLSVSDERNAREFRKMVEGEEEVDWMRGVSGRVFRSPTLFEDMVKCILLCNCQWSRTLSMARALCELQLELHHQSSVEVLVGDAHGNMKRVEMENSSNLAPMTPSPGKYSKRKSKTPTTATNLTLKFTEGNVDSEQVECLEREADDSSEGCKECPAIESFRNGPLADAKIGNFPTPLELASLDARFLAKRCNLGYRAARIIKLAQGVVEGKILLHELEQVCDGGCSSQYDEMANKLRKIDGFGPFTCANVLMCMGFYHVIPTDSETLRHLKQVHAKVSTMQTVQQDVNEVYGKYAPFQFLAYWAEMWYFYEQKFGKLSQLSCSGYGLITGSNMRKEGSCRCKRTKTS